MAAYLGKIRVTMLDCADGSRLNQDILLVRSKFRNMSGEFSFHSRCYFTRDHSLARPAVEDGENGLYIRRTAANILNIRV
jgi:hypothetical protein